MKYTKNNVIALLERMEDNTYKCAKIHEETHGKDSFYHSQIAEMCGLSEAIHILKSKETFDDRVNIFFQENN